MELEDFPPRNKIKSANDMIYDTTYPEKLKFRELYHETINTLMEKLKEYERDSKGAPLRIKEIFREETRFKLKEAKDKFDKEFEEKFPPSKWLLELIASRNI